MAYHSTCIKCTQLWNGWGPYCNHCRQIMAIEKQSQAANDSKSFIDMDEWDAFVESLSDDNESQADRDFRSILRKNR